MRARVASALFVWTIAVVSAAAQSAQDELRVQQFVAALQQASAKDDRIALAGMMRFPLGVMSSGFRLPVNDVKGFNELYAQIFTPGTKALIARARAPQTGRVSPTVALAPDGSAVIEGAIRIDVVGDGLKITQFNVPAAPARNSAGGGGSAATAARRLSFRAGRPTEVNGAIDPDGKDLYDVNVAQGTLLDVRLSGVQGNTVLVRIVDAKSGTPIDARAGNGTRVWTGRVPATSTYRIEVVRPPGTGTGTLLYVLSVALK